MLRFFYRNRQEQDTPFLKNGITLLNAMALFAWLTTHALLSDYYSLIGKVDYNPRFIVQIYYSLHQRWNVPCATPSFLAAALPEISPLRHAAMMDS